MQSAPHTPMQVLTCIITATLIITVKIKQLDRIYWDRSDKSRERLGWRRAVCASPSHDMELDMEKLNSSQMRLFSY